MDLLSPATREILTALDSAREKRASAPIVAPTPTWSKTAEQLRQVAMKLRALNQDITPADVADFEARYAKR